MAVRGAWWKNVIRELRLGSTNIQIVHRSRTTPQPIGKTTNSMKMNAATYQPMRDILTVTQSKLTFKTSNCWRTALRTALPALLAFPTVRMLR